MCLSIKVYRRLLINMLLYHYIYILKIGWKRAIQSFGFEVGLLKYANFLGEYYQSSSVVLTEDAAVGFTLTREC